jgi:dihydrodipicolinate synthase/N-acetylneuraminate lyase
MLVQLSAMKTLSQALLTALNAQLAVALEALEHLTEWQLSNASL